MIDTDGLEWSFPEMQEDGDYIIKVSDPESGRFVGHKLRKAVDHWGDDLPIVMSPLLAQCVNKGNFIPFLVCREQLLRWAGKWSREKDTRVPIQMRPESSGILWSLPEMGDDGKYHVFATDTVNGNKLGYQLVEPIEFCRDEVFSVTSELVSRCNSYNRIGCQFVGIELIRVRELQIRYSLPMWEKLPPALS